jgi:hypothetical protein
MEILLVLTALANAVSAIIAWVAKILWSKEYREAKDETIRAKEAQITTLKEHISILEKLNPTILRQWYESGLKISEIYASQLEQQMKEAQKKTEVLEADSDKREKAIMALKSLKSGNEKITQAITHRLLPDSGTIATSAENSTVLEKTTSAKPPAIRNELLRFYSIYTDKACPKCQAQMLTNPVTGKHYCEECEYKE